MGHRCNTARLKQGKLKISVSNWGGLDLASTVFWGPDTARALIEDNEPAKRWLDEAFAEGALALNEDTLSACVYSLDIAPDLRDDFVALMRAQWRLSSGQDWTISWGDRGLPDVVAALGLDPLEPSGDDGLEAGVRDQLQAFLTSRNIPRPPPLSPVQRRDLLCATLLGHESPSPEAFAGLHSRLMSLTAALSDEALSDLAAERLTAERNARNDPQRLLDRLFKRDAQLPPKLVPDTLDEVNGAGLLLVRAWRNVDSAG